MWKGTADYVWFELSQHVLMKGNTVYARGRHTREWQGAAAEIDMRFPIVTFPQRKLGYRFMMAEAFWILSGRNDLASIRPYSKTISQFSDDGHFFFGAYGPKIVAQLPHVLKSLGADPFSRQAVINIWRESPPKSKDLPCSIAVQFLFRDGALHCHYTMRSSDLWLGAPYDWFNFSMLTAYVLLLLRNMFPSSLWNHAVPGYLHYRAASCHLYHENLETISKLGTEVLAVSRPYRPLLLDEFREPRHLLQHLEALANYHPASGLALNHNFALETIKWREAQAIDQRS